MRYVIANVVSLGSGYTRELILPFLGAPQWSPGVIGLIVEIDIDFKFLTFFLCFVYEIINDVAKFRWKTRLVLS